MQKHKPSFIESIAEKLGLIENLHAFEAEEIPRINEPGELSNYPPPEMWTIGRSMNRRAETGARRRII